MKQSKEEIILAAVRDNPGSTRTELSEILHLPYSIIQYHLTTLYHSGEVIKSYVRGDFRKYRYWISDDNVGRGVDCNKCQYSREEPLLTHCSTCIHNEDFADYYSPSANEEHR